MMSPALSTKEFRLFQSLVHREAGISLSDQKRALLTGRLGPRLRALELSSFGAYFDRVTADHEELVRMLDCICTNETHFFREPKQFDFLEQAVIPQWRASADAGVRRREVRVWSAGCSTGEEPYSIAMMLAAALPDWRIEVLATDLSTKVLHRAESALWPVARAEEVPARFRRAFLLRGRRSQEGLMTVRPELAAMVRLARVNLYSDPYPQGPFDAIFCRNVMIYFDAVTKQRIVDRLLDRLDPAGYFFLGHAESLNSSPRVRAAGPTIYQLRETS